MPDAVSTLPLPDVAILHPAKVASPELVVTGLVVQVSVPWPDVRVRVIAVADALVTVLPLESWIATTGCCDHVMATTPPPG